MTEMAALGEVDRRATRHPIASRIREQQLGLRGHGDGDRVRITPLQHTDVRDHRPDVLILVRVAERRHRREPEPVLDDPEELRVGLAFHGVGGEVGRVRIRRGAENAAAVAFRAVTDGTGSGVRGTSRGKSAGIVPARITGIAAQEP